MSALISRKQCQPLKEVKDFNYEDVFIPKDCDETEKSNSFSDNYISQGDDEYNNVCTSTQVESPNSSKLGRSLSFLTTKEYISDIKKNKLRFIHSSLSCGRISVWSDNCSV
jgi:hypothetical protein